MSRFHIVEAYPHVFVALAQYTSDEAGNILITSGHVSDQEIDFAIEDLKSQLDVAGTQAKKKLKHLRERVKAK